MRRLTVVVCTAVVLGAPTGAHARAGVGPPAFSPGRWTGRMTIQGAIDNATVR